MLHATFGGVTIGISDEDLLLGTNGLQLFSRFQAGRATLGLGRLEESDLLVQALDFAMRPARDAMAKNQERREKVSSRFSNNGKGQ